MSFAVLTFFHLLAQTSLLEPLNLVLTPLVAYIPKLVNCVVLLVVAFLVAILLKRVAAGLLTLVKIDAKLNEAIGDAPSARDSVSSLVANIVFWLALLFFLPAIVSPFALPDLVEPIVHITDRVFGFVPNIVAAVVILLVGVFVLRIIRRLVAGALAKAGLDRVTEKWGQTAGLGDTRLSGLLAQTLYLLLLFSLCIAALQALNLEAVYAPAAQ